MKIHVKGNLTICPAGIEDLCGKRDELHRSILQEEEEKQKLQNDIRVLTERLAKVNESLAKKMASRNEFDKTIAETEAAYMKVGRRILYNYNNNKALIERFQNLKVLYNLKKNIQCTNTHNYTNP